MAVPQEPNKSKILAQALISTKLIPDINITRIAHTRAIIPKIIIQAIGNPKIRMILKKENRNLTNNNKMNKRFLHHNLVKNLLTSNKSTHVRKLRMTSSDGNRKIIHNKCIRERRQRKNR